jgi:hypothetical protein
MTLCDFEISNYRVYARKLWRDWLNFKEIHELPYSSHNKSPKSKNKWNALIK